MSTVIQFTEEQVTVAIDPVVNTVEVADENPVVAFEQENVYVVLGDDPARLGTIDHNRVLGRVLPGTGDVTQLTPTELTTLVEPFTESTSGAVSAPGTADETKFLRDDGVWAVPPGAGGGGTITEVTADEINIHVDSSVPVHPVISMKEMPAETFKGRPLDAGPGDPLNLTMTELRAMLGLGQGSEVRGASFVGFNSRIHIPTGKVNITIKEDCRIKKCVILTQGGNGSCVVDIQKVPYASFPPTSANSIVGATPPTIVNNIKYTDAALSDWTTVLSEGDTLQFELVSTDLFRAIFVFLILQPVMSLPTDGYTDARVREIFAEELANGNIIVTGSTYNFTLFGGLAEDLILWDTLGQPSGPVTVNFRIPAGAVIRSSSTSNAALDCRGFASGSEINIINLGAILGKGGKGGDGGNASNTNGEAGGSGQTGIGGKAPTAGFPGGDAIVLGDPGVTINITNANGYIFGGGGGGAPGGFTIKFTGQLHVAAAGPGGGGAGGGLPGDPGSGFAASSGAMTTAVSGIATPGGSSRNSGGGTGGVGSENGLAEGGDGGAGGPWGANGSVGQSPTGQDKDFAAPPAGLAGKAIKLNGVSVTFVSGNDSTHVKGAVS